MSTALCSKPAWAAACCALAGASPPIGCTLALADLLFSLSSSGCSSADYEVWRPLEEREGNALEVGAVGDVSRPFLRVGSGAEHARRWELGAIRRGFLRAYFALASGEQGSGVAELTLRAQGVVWGIWGELSQTCRHQWRSPEARAQWLECRLPIARDLRRATLSVRFAGPPDEELLLASPILVSAAAPQQSSAFVILLDTARLDAFKTFNASMPIGAELDILARDSVVFENLRAPSSWTRTSVASLFTGLPPRAHQVFGRRDTLPPSLPSLPAQLQANGYLTFAVVANPNILPLWGFAHGFDSLVDIRSHAWVAVKGDAREVFEQVRQQVEANRDTPALHYVHLMDPHHPYVPPPGQLARVTMVEEALAQSFPVARSTKEAQEVWSDGYRKYAAEVRDADQHIGAFLAFLKQAGLYSDALILVTSDHGEEFLDHGGLNHGRTLYEEVLRVPALLKLPGNARAGSRITRPVDLRELMPAMLAALGVSLPQGLQPVDLFAADGDGDPRIAQLLLDEYRLSAVSQGGWKLIVDHRSGGVELYDLRADPREQNDLSDREPAKVDELRSLLERLTARHAPGWHLRACGCTESRTLRFTLRGSGGDLAALTLEEDDLISPSAEGEGVELRLTLPLRVARHERFEEAFETELPDEDELLLAGSVSGKGAEGPWVGAVPPDVLRVALGRESVHPLEGWLDLGAALKAATVRPDDPIDCEPPRPFFVPAADSCRPYLRIWYAPPPHEIAAGAIDPEVRERLKALGYRW